MAGLPLRALSQQRRRRLDEYIGTRCREETTNLILHGELDVAKRWPTEAGGDDVSILQESQSAYLRWPS
jgi:hypothetical protein